MGYKPGRSVVVYLAVIFGLVFFGQSDSVTFSPLGALVFSVTSFHGRGFFLGASRSTAATVRRRRSHISLLIRLTSLPPSRSASLEVCLLNGHSVPRSTWELRRQELVSVTV
jgi:hypothetical protein